MLHSAQAFATQAAEKAYSQNASPPAVVLPAVVPYIPFQLEHLTYLAKLM